jgi:hypothetical protein
VAQAAPAAVPAQNLSHSLELVVPRGRSSHLSLGQTTY